MLLTVFTPTYNRRELLGRVYQSLLSQTCRDFCWLIVDDGSADDTKQAVQGWIEEKQIPITYIYRENGGKMRAHNTGVAHCTTELFMCLDSDDYLPADAVEQLTETWRDVQSESVREASAQREPAEKSAQQIDKTAGIVAHKGRSATQILTGGEFADIKYSTLQNLYRQGFSGETALVFRTDILRQFPFPEIDGEKYVPEDYIYDKIDKEYVLRVLPQIIMICELVSSGYTDSVERLRREHPQAWLLYYEQRAQDAPASLLKIKYISHYMRFSKHLGKSIWRSGNGISLGWRLLGLPGYFLLALRHKD